MSASTLDNADGTIDAFGFRPVAARSFASKAIGDAGQWQPGDGAVFDSVKLNRGDDVAVTVKRTGKGFSVDISGDALDARSMVKQFTVRHQHRDQGGRLGPVSRHAPTSETLDRLSRRAAVERQARLQRLRRRGERPRQSAATTGSGKTVEIRNGSEGGGRSMRMQSADAGAILRFLDIYEHMEGGSDRPVARPAAPTAR